MLDQSGLAKLSALYEREGLHSTEVISRLTYRADRLLPGDVRGKRVLDVGAGPGHLALYLTLVRGASVHALDEYEGHGSEAVNFEKLKWRARELDIPNMAVTKADLRSAVLPPNSYHIVLLSNTLHHIFLRGEASQIEVSRTMSSVYDWLTSGGQMVMGEARPSTLWSRIPRRWRPFARSVVYRSKSNPSWWRECAGAAGFSFYRLDWYVPYRLRTLHRLMANEVAGWLLTGEYMLRMIKPTAEC